MQELPVRPINSVDMFNTLHAAGEAGYYCTPLNTDLWVKRSAVMDFPVNVGVCCADGTVEVI